MIMGDQAGENQNGNRHKGDRVREKPAPAWRRPQHKSCGRHQRALDEQVREELKIGEAHATPFREGWVTGVATAVGAFIPVFPFLAFPGRTAVWTAFSIAMLSHFAVGAARSFFTGREDRRRRRRRRRTPKTRSW